MKKRITSLILAFILVLTMMPATVMASVEEPERPELGLYMGESFETADEVEYITINQSNQGKFYIALKPASVDAGFTMDQVQEEFEDDKYDASVTTLGTVTVSDDKTYVTVQVEDFAAEGSYYFRVTNKRNGEDAGYCGMSLYIENDMPKLYYCYLDREDDEWFVKTDHPDNELWCVPGFDHTVRFYFGSKDEIRSGNAAVVPMDKLVFPAYVKAEDFREFGEEDAPEDSVRLYTTRFNDADEMNQIIYTKDDVDYTLDTVVELPEIGTYSGATSGEDSYIYREKPFVVTETDRTFYICSVDTSRVRLTNIEEWLGHADEEMFTATPSMDGNGQADGRYFQITVNDDVIVEDGDYGVRCKVKYYNEREELWETEDSYTWFVLKNGQPTLSWKNVEWNDQEQEWFIPENGEFHTQLYISAGDEFPIQFYYGLGDDLVTVDYQDLTFPTVAEGFEKEGYAWIKGTGYDESGFITYTQNGTTVKMHVNVSQPDFGFYSDVTPSKSTFLWGIVEVDSADDCFYVVADQEHKIPVNTTIRFNRYGNDATNQFDVTVAPDGSHAVIKMVKDSEGNLTMGGGYNMEIEQDWGTRYLQFELIRMDLTQLSTPTDLSWNREFEWDNQNASQSVERMGSMSFKRGDLFQNQIDVEIYSSADNYKTPIHTGGWRFGDQNNSKYFSITDFIYGEFGSGTYKFRVRAEGDGTKYRDSEWSELSPEWTYTQPQDRLADPENLKWDRHNGRYFSVWDKSTVAAVGYYEVNWGYMKNDSILWNAGSFDIRTEEFSGDFAEVSIHDDFLSEAGNADIYFMVRAIPKDITAIRLSNWVTYEIPLEIEEISDYVNGKIDDLVGGTTSGSAVVTVQDVQDTLVGDTADLRTAMAADLELSGGASNGTLDKIQALENAVSNNVDQVVVAKNSAPQAIQNIAGGVTMIGATLNLADNHPEQGRPASVTLELDAPKQGIVIDEQQHNAVQFSMKLKGAVNHDDQDQASQQLIVPIVIDMPVPSGMNPEFLVVLHKLWDGSIEQLWPYIYMDEATNRFHARFVIDSFSDFAFVEYNFGFSVDTVNKTEGDTNFTIAATGNASGSAITYASSNPEVATVNEETGEVTILGIGTVTITATASQTDIYPETEDSYTLVVAARQTNNDGPSRPSRPNPSTPAPVEPEEQPKVEMTFTDVKKEAYYFNAVNWAVEQGITSGTSEDTFSPDATCTRAQMMTFLWKAAGCPEPAGNGTLFGDVKADSYYAKAVLWAVENGITSGTSVDTFSPDANCTRAQMAMFLYKNAVLNSKDLNVDGSQLPFIDAEGFAKDAIAWCYQNGITSGTSTTTFSPEATCTRAQMITFLYNNFGK